MFSKKRIATALVAGVMAASMLLTACTTAPGSGTSANKYPGTPGTDSVTVLQTAEPRDLCSITTTDASSIDTLRPIIDGLTLLDANDHAVPGVAKDWKISEDGMTYTFNLRQDYKWSNGTPVTAHDFVFSIRALITPTFASDYAYIGYIIKNAESFANGKAAVEDVGVKAIDDYTLELTLEYTAPFILELLAFVSFLPVNQEFYEAQDGKYGTTAANLLFNGPYVMDSWVNNAEIKYSKNPNYPDAKDVKIEKIITPIVKDSNTAMNMFKAGQLDLVGLNSEQLAMMESEGQPTFNYNDGAVAYLEFNVQDPILKNVNIRRALQLAIDADGFVKNVLANKSIAATSFTPPGIAGNKKDFVEEIGAQFKSHDIEEAKKLLEAGKTELGIDTIELTFLTEDSDVAGKYSAYIQETLSNELGITIKISQMPFAVKLDRLSNKDFQVCMSLWSPDYNDPITYLDMFETGGGNNHGGYSNAEYDDLLKKVRVETDREKRFEYLARIEAIIAEEAPIAPYYFRFRDYTHSAKLDGLVRTMFQTTQLRWASIK